MGAYDNPQRVVNNSFNALIQSGKQLTNNIATTAQQISANVKAQKKQAQMEQDALDIEQQSMFSKVNELPSTSSEALDNNIHSFWDAKVDEYFRIKNEMDAGTYKGGRAAGNKALSKINALVPQFQAQAKYLAEQCGSYNSAIKDQTLSSTGSMINKNFLSALCNGGDVRTIEKDGQLVYQLGEDGEFLNGTALMSNAAGDENLFNNKADFTKLEQNMYNKLAQPDSPNSDYLITKKFKKGDPNPITGEPMNNLQEGYMYDMQYIMPEKKDEYLKNAFNSPMMNAMLLDDKAMLSEWQDNIPDGFSDGSATGEENSIAGIASQLNITDDQLAELDMTMDDLVNSSWHEYPSNYTDDQKQKLDAIQNKIAKTYIARKSYDNNGLQLGALKTKNREKIKDESTASESTRNRFTTTQQTIYDNRKDDFITNRDTAEDMYADGTPDAQTFVTALQNADPTGDYFVNDKGLIQSGNSIVSIPTNAKNASVVLNSKGGIDRTMQNVFNKENPYQTAEVEEEENVNETSSAPEGSTVYKSSATEKKTFDGVLTEDEILLFNKAYPESDFNSGPLYEEQIKKLSQNPPSGMSRAAYAQSPEIKEKAIRILKRKQAVEDAADAKEMGETLDNYYS